MGQYGSELGDRHNVIGCTGYIGCAKGGKIIYQSANSSVCCTKLWTCSCWSSCDISGGLCNPTWNLPWSLPWLLIRNRD